jgi:tellurite resistance protein
MSSMPKGGAVEVESTVLGNLRQAVAILQAKAPQDLQTYRDVVVAACDQVAQASEGVNETETAMMAR